MAALKIEKLMRLFPKAVLLTVVSAGLFFTYGVILLLNEVVLGITFPKSGWTYLMLLFLLCASIASMVATVVIGVWLYVASYREDAGSDQ